MASPKRWLSWRGLALVPALAMLVAVAVLALDRETGLLSLVKLMEQVEQAETRVAALETHRQQLIAEVRGLRSDPIAIETAARVQLGMVRPGEIVLRWERAGSSSD